MNASILGPGFADYSLVLTPYFPVQIFPLLGEAFVDIYNVIDILEVKTSIIDILAFAVTDEFHNQVPGGVLCRSGRGATNWRDASGVGLFVWLS